LLLVADIGRAYRRYYDAYGWSGQVANHPYPCGGGNFHQGQVVREEQHRMIPVHHLTSG
jgi:hypothetical protein